MQRAGCHGKVMCASVSNQGVGIELIGYDKAMTVQQKQNLTIKFGDCDAGWILMRVSNGECSLVVAMSHFLDPLPDMLAWFEAIIIGVQQCEFRVDEERQFTNFAAKREFRPKEDWRAYTILNIHQEDATQPLQVSLPTFELVGVFYRAFREFAESSEYVRKNWERITLENVVNEKLGMTADAWIDSVIALESRELQKAIWKIDPYIETKPAIYMDDLGTEAELMELTGQTRAAAGGLPRYCVLPQELWGCYAIRDEQAQREYLKEYLSENLFTSWDGMPWRKIRSSLIEDRLASGSPGTHSYWARWRT